MESDDDFGYDLSPEDELLLATLADGASKSCCSSHHATCLSHHDDHAVAPNLGRGSQQAPTTALRAVGRTHSVDAFVQAMQPQPALPSAVPVDNVQYPDRKYSNEPIVAHPAKWANPD